MAYHEQTFQQKFGDLFTVSFPEVEIEVVGKDVLRDHSPEENPGDKLIDFIEKEKPDLILLDAEQIAPLVDKGKLLQLDAVMKQEQFDTTGIPALTMDFFRQLGDGHIYVLSPTYDVSAIYYNEDLFKEYAIEPPRNQMTWEELFLIASRFGQLSTEQNPLYGISTLFSNPMDILLNVAQTKELRIIDNDREELLLNSDGWKEAYRLVTDTIKANGFYMADGTVEQIDLNDTMFARGQSAMTIVHATSTKMIQGDSSFKVGLVTMPINPANPEVSPFMSFDNMYAINADSPISESLGSCYHICAALKWPKPSHLALVSVCPSEMKESPRSVVYRLNHSLF
ncbi:extracellular solute-binding protein [Paenibacillus sp. D2_2]|uniref:ABC transporter substrate-binding protein n=1 Tax=Paenibacillus sp. D2_2 TaxID=3073092 RepID=UPI002816925F|nr:extracellular solute-binding protein [Paenibacillus sp. D2_2]WMT41519.1 extracellular solute-binding protein [Paenibacillus sp. D2_2]